jgi:flagellar biosynthesis GTPase FlhF
MKQPNHHTYTTEHETLIPYEFFPTDEDSGYDRETMIHTPHCIRDNLAIFFEAIKEPGFSDPEELLCPFCRSPLYRGLNTDNIIGSTSTPKVIACLKLTKNKILQLVFTEYCSEIQKAVLQEHILKLNFSTYANLLELRQSDKFFHQRLKSPAINKFFLKSSLRSSIKLNKKSESSNKPIERKKPNEKAASTNLADKKSKQYLITLAKMREAYKNSQRVYQNFIHSPKKPSKENLSSTFAFSPKDIKNLNPNKKLLKELDSTVEKSKPLSLRRLVVRTKKAKTGTTIKSNKG